MKPVLRVRSLLGLSVTIAAAYALYDSWHWPYKTALFPRLMSVPLLVLGLLETLLCLYVPEGQREGAAVDFEFSAGVDPIIARNRTLSLILWVLGFFALILLIGFLWAVPLFIFLYLKVEGKEAWVLTILLTALSWLFMEGLFDRLLHIPFSQGWLLSF
ncbi:MAG TPA: tripartite tricarboxylate transporter TctB family protein [Geobacteraceae bacterium]|nr:tripartite tricarboxylate transporter TctB family protein [Geobacteraceae bacterium]